MFEKESDLFLHVNVYGVAMRMIIRKPISLFSVAYYNILLPLINELSIRPHSKLSLLVHMSSFPRLQFHPFSPRFNLALWTSGLYHSKIVRMALLSSH